MDKSHRDGSERRSRQHAPSKPDRDAVVRGFAHIIALGAARVVRGRQAA